VMKACEPSAGSTQIDDGGSLPAPATYINRKEVSAELIDVQMSDSFIRTLSNRLRYITVRIALLQKNVKSLNNLKPN